MPEKQPIRTSIDPDKIVELLLQKFELEDADMAGVAIYFLDPQHVKMDSDENPEGYLADPDYSKNLKVAGDEIEEVGGLDMTLATVLANPESTFISYDSDERIICIFN